MANDGFNGTTITIGSAQTPLIDLTHTRSAAKVDVTGCGDQIHNYEVGLPDDTITFTVVGVSGLDPEDATSAVTVAWYDGTSTGYAGMVCTDAVVSGSLDGTITTALTYVPSSTVATTT